MIKGYWSRSIKRRIKRIGSLLNIGTICIVMIMALGILGASYAAWNQSFNIFGSISTGEISTVVRSITLESSDAYESLDFDTDMEDGTVKEAALEVVTNASPFNCILVFTVENNGTIPVSCEGIDPSIPDGLDIQVIEAPSRIEAGQTAPIKVRITKGYCEDLEFSTLLRFSQVVY
jgi:predicted ribosomally synthesized peptide with SipW-like signal peptide